MKGHTGGILSVAWSPDGRHVLTGSYDKTAKVWDAVTGNEVMTMRGHTSYIDSAAWSPDGRHVLTGSHDKTAKVWDAAKTKFFQTVLTFC